MTDDLFDTAHYATGLRERMRRGFELGPKYYLLDVPRYVRQRLRRGLPLLDLEALWNPVRSFRNMSYLQLPLPPHYDEALALLHAAGVRFDNPRSRIEALVGLWWDVHAVAGDVIECGAYRGATSLLLAVLGRLEGVPQKVLMMDTFAGMPPPSAYDSSRRAGEFAPPDGWPDIIRRQTTELGVADRVEIHQGLFSEHFPALATRGVRFSFAHIDANIYQGTLEACEFTLPRMAAGGAVVFDDYNGLMDLGARLAIDEAVTRRGKKPLPLAECSAYLRT
jgi:hypothetical protein